MSVYFAEAGGYVKVGHSIDVIGRSATITRLGKRPDDLPLGAPARLLGWIPGDVWREMELLVRFAARRVAGEWFTLDILTEVRDLIWSDPRGVDIQRMSAQAVFVALRYPEATREQMEKAGVRIEAAPLADGLRAMSAELVTT